MREKTELGEHQQLALKTYTKMVRATESVTAKMHKHLAQYKLTISQFGVLEALCHLGPLCQRDIGRKILKTSGNITLVIDNLERRELVVREKDLNDRRFITVKLTKKGESLISEIFPLHAKIASKVFSVLNSQELEGLGRTLKILGKSDGKTNNN